MLLSKARCRSRAERSLMSQTFDFWVCKHVTGIYRTLGVLVEKDELR